jgi:hypothetical protein
MHPKCNNRPHTSVSPTSTPVIQLQVHSQPSTTGQAAQVPSTDIVPAMIPELHATVHAVQGHAPAMPHPALPITAALTCVIRLALCCVAYAYLAASPAPCNHLLQLEPHPTNRMYAHYTFFSTAHNSQALAINTTNRTVAHMACPYFHTDRTSIQNSARSNGQQLMLAFSYTPPVHVCTINRHHNAFWHASRRG